VAIGAGFGSELVVQFDDPKTTEIVSATAKGLDKVLIELQQKAGIQGRMRIEMQKVDDEWKVARRWILFKDGKEMATSL